MKALTDDAIRVEFSKLIASLHGGDVSRYFAHLSGDSDQIHAKTKALVASREAAWDVLLQATGQT